MIAARLLILLVMLYSFIAATASNAQELKLATTTSTENSGLMAYLLPKFTKKTDIKVSYSAVGTGAALRYGRNGMIDVLLVHAPEAETQFMNANYGVRRELVMFNDFIITGPAQIPATTTKAALRWIAENNKTFVSRADNSGTHKKEHQLWHSINLDPIGENWYLEFGQSMGKTLLQANKVAGYTLVDRGVWLKMEQQTNLKIAFENTAELINPYSAIVINPQKFKVNVDLANNFVDWLISEEGQNYISQYRVNDKVLFKPVSLFKQ